MTIITTAAATTLVALVALAVLIGLVAIAYTLGRTYVSSRPARVSAARPAVPVFHGRLAH